GTIYVVRDGKAHRVAVRVGRDTGVDAEILEGLSPDDQVIVRYNGSLAEGVAVQSEPDATAPAPSEEAGEAKEAAAQGAPGPARSGAVQASGGGPGTAAAPGLGGPAGPRGRGQGAAEGGGGR